MNKFFSMLLLVVAIVGSLATSIGVSAQTGNRIVTKGYLGADMSVIMAVHMEAPSLSVAKLAMQDGFIENLYMPLKAEGFLNDMAEIGMPKTVQQTRFPKADEVRSFAAFTSEFGTRQSVTLHIMRMKTNIFAFYEADSLQMAFQDYINATLRNGTLAGPPRGYTEFYNDIEFI